MKRRVLGLICAVVGLVAAGCASDVDVGSLRGKLERSGYTAEQARCVSSRVFEEFEQDEINEVDRAGQLTDLSRATRDQINEIASECDVPRGERG